MLAQDDVLPPGATLRDVVVGDRPEHDWASDARVRDVLDGLLGGVAASAYREGLATTIATMSGGERRRAALAVLLVAEADLLLTVTDGSPLDLLKDTLRGERPGQVAALMADRLARRKAD